MVGGEDTGTTWPYTSGASWADKMAADSAPSPLSMVVTTCGDLGPWIALPPTLRSPKGGGPGKELGLAHQASARSRQWPCFQSVRTFSRVPKLKCLAEIFTSQHPPCVSYTQIISEANSSGFTLQMGALEEMEAVALCWQWRMMRLRLSCTYRQFRSSDTISKTRKPWIMLWPWEWISKQKARDFLLVLFSSLVSLPGLEPPAVNCWLTWMVSTVSEVYAGSHAAFLWPQSTQSSPWKWTVVEESYWATVHMCFLMVIIYICGYYL